MAFRVLIFILLISGLSSASLEIEASTYKRTSVGQRLLLSFNETPHGSNRTFECSPSGPCVPCLYSEKNDEKYRCSETGYRIPLKCVESEDVSRSESQQKTQKSRSALEISNNSLKPHVMLHDAELLSMIKHRNLLDKSLMSVGKSEAYITYRSCIPAVNEEKLSVLGFEGIVLGLLLISSSAIYVRRKRTATMLGVGAGRNQVNSRF